MQRNLLAIAITLFGTRTVHADEPIATLAGTASIGGLGNLWAMSQLELDASWRSKAPDWWFRGGASLGLTSAVDEGEGSVYELRVGIEHAPRCCFYYGVDLAFVSGEMHDDPEDWQMTGGLAVPRAGINIRGDRFGFRLGVETPLGIGRVHYTGYGETTSTDLIRGFSASATFVVVVE